MITIQQIKAARAMLGYSQQMLAKKAGISVATLNNIERAAQTDHKLSTLNAIRRALESGGIEFMDEASGGVGIRLKPSPKTNGAARILIIDDNHADRMLYKRWLSDAEGKEYQVIEAGDAKAGFEAFIEHNPDCILLDFKMYGMDGFQLIVEMKKDYPIIPPIIFITGMHDKELEHNVRRVGVHSYVNKNSLDQAQLIREVSSALEK